MAKAQHVKRGSRVSRVVMVAAGAAVVVAGGVTLAVLLNGSSSGKGAAGVAADTTPTTVKPVVLSVTPIEGATNVGLDTIISVNVAAGSGRLNSVVVSGATGAALPGSMDVSGMSWRSSGKLALKTSYTVTIDATNSKGKATQQVTHFQSLVPTATLTASIFPNNGLTVGIGQPIKLTFNHPVVNKDAMLAQLLVSTSPPVAGGWHWFSDKELHFRPQVYWASGTQVSLTARLANFDAGNGIWATSDSSTKFTVGDAHISTANVSTHASSRTSTWCRLQSEYPSTHPTATTSTSTGTS